MIIAETSDNLAFQPSLPEWVYYTCTQRFYVWGFSYQQMSYRYSGRNPAFYDFPNISVGYLNDSVYALYPDIDPITDWMPPMLAATGRSDPYLWRNDRPTPMIDDPEYPDWLQGQWFGLVIWQMYAVLVSETYQVLTAKGTMGRKPKT